MAETGIERIAAAFAAAGAEGRAALMPYMMGGFPDLETSAAVIDAYADAGADLIELGGPYSDPLADGPTIHAAGTAALAAGARFESVMELCGRVADRVPVEVVELLENLVAFQSRKLSELQSNHRFGLSLRHAATSLPDFTDATGRRLIRTRVPLPGSLSTAIAPPCFTTTMLCAMLRP